MSLDPGVVGAPWPAGTRSWSSSDALLYALGVGAGSDERFDELSFVTENSRGRPQQVLPSFVVTLGALGPEQVDISRLLHAGMEIELHGELPPDGTAESRTVVEEVLDKGRDAFVLVRTVLSDPATGAVLAVTRSTSLVVGGGGFGGPRRSAAAPWKLPDRDSDVSLTLATRHEQALLYRLSGDRNPLHSDPAAAADAGFPAPILHGLCTFGVAARALLHSCAGGDPARFGRMAVRFTAPVLPGDVLRVDAWEDAGEVRFRVVVEERVVLDRGVFRPRSPGSEG